MLCHSSIPKKQKNLGPLSPTHLALFFCIPEKNAFFGRFGPVFPVLGCRPHLIGRAARGRGKADLSPAQAHKGVRLGRSLAIFSHKCYSTCAVCPRLLAHSIRCDTLSERFSGEYHIRTYDSPHRSASCLRTLAGSDPRLGRCRAGAL